jgi:uncharacterized protein (TIGR02246 family)
MKQLLALTLVVALSVVARAEQKAAAPTSDEAAVRKLEQTWYTALEKGDFATLDSLVPNDDCMMIDPFGQMYNIRQTIAELKAGTYAIASCRIDEMKVAVYGDTVVVFGLETEKSKYKGEDTSGQYRFTDTWLKRNGRWVCVATANVRVPPPKS